MPVGWGMAAGSLIGGLLGGSASKSAASTAANAQLEAARIQAEAAKFKPYNVSTGFGSATFDTDKGTAGYTLDPRLSAMRDLLYGGATGIMPSGATQQFYGDIQQQAQQRAMQAMGMSPEAAAAKEYETIQGLLSPQRARDQASLAQNLFKTGRSGFGTSYGAGGGYINPQQYAYMKALEEQNTQLGLTSLDRARQRQSQEVQDYFNLAGQAPTALAGLYGTGAGLFSKGMGIEEAGLTPLELGINIGGKATTSARNAAHAMAGGITGAADWQAAGTMGQARAMQNMFGDLGKYNWNKMFGGGGNTPTSSQYNIGYGNTGSLFSSPSTGTGDRYSLGSSYDPFAGSASPAYSLTGYTDPFGE